MKKFLYEGNQIQVIEKKSKFIAESFKVRNVDECEEILQALRKKYWDATHNCYAYRIDEMNKKCSDDGEPSKTAGYPILDVIDKQNINECMVVVTRYFGGILLGTGGLVHAYSNSAALAIKSSKIIEVVDGYEINLDISYELYGKLQYILNELEIYIHNSEFTEIVSLLIYVEEEKYKQLHTKLKELYKTDEPISQKRKIQFAILNGELVIYD